MPYDKINNCDQLLLTSNGMLLDDISFGAMFGNENFKRTWYT